ncbi:MULTISPECIES: peptidyl-prolyl cis-trans isomerase [Leptotrichia]|uniref:peptidylprolyl isomerase n=1 Tax=Leptotrichia TaxID=32067 RepID=UPI0015BAC2C8|nr:MULTISPECIES: peptidyl-prolyl cis-trans isomerase [Leptotrichia]NWO19035.1 peptidyl-prolyl cis-trans isomerase [Leptotrichia sp. oral taxon 223]
MKNKIKIGVLTLLCIFAMSCGNNGGQSGKVLFESSDKKIKVYESEVNNELEKGLFSNGLTEKDLTPEQITQMRQSIIKNIAINRAIALKGKEEKLNKDKKYTESQNILQEQLLANLAIFNELNDKAKVSDEDAKNIYDANAANFTRQEDTVRLQLIVFNTSDSAKANQVLKEAVANPANFTAYAQKYNASIQGVTENGETQEIPLSQLESRFGPLNEAIKNVAPGKIVNSVVTVGNDLYIVKVLEKNTKGLIPFEKVKDAIKTQLRNQKRQAEQQKFIKSVTDEYKLSNIDEAVKNIK